MPRARWVRVRCETTRCPTCEQPMTLLQHENAIGAMFYICWICTEIVQAGAGPVKEER